MRIFTPAPRALWPFGLLLAVVASLYGQSLGFGYIWDDNSLFVDNTMLREGVWSWAAVARPILPDTSYFRPLVLTTWMAEMQLFKLTPLYSHLINVILHGINTCLVYVIACAIYGSRDKTRIAALVAALIFSAHPCLAEGVAWISGRFDLLATTMLLAGFATAMAPATVFRCMAVGIFALGALFSKETGILFAPLLVLLAIARSPGRPLRVTLADLWPYLLVSAATTIIYFILRRQALGVVSYSEFGLMQLASGFANYEFWMRALSFYTFMGFMPFSSISPQHDILLELASARQHIAALAVALAILAVVVYFAIKRQTWAILWIGFYAGIFPVLGILSIRLADTIGAERFMYLPLVMLALASVALFLEIRDKYPLQRIISLMGAAVAGGWLVLSLLVTYTVTSMWESGVKLWSWQYQSRPENQMVLMNYLVHLSSSREPELEKKFEIEIEKIQSRNRGRLPMEVQGIYAIYLLTKQNPEAIPYLQGLVDNSVGIWDQPREQLGLMKSLKYSSILANYAQALMIFNGDLKLARETLNRSKALTGRGGEFQFVHSMIALEYLAGNKADALNLYRENLEMLHAYDIHKMHASIRTLIQFTCLQLKGENCKPQALEFIEELKKESLVPSR
ncbi:glycosyltransferase family 39 protein [Acidovorax sp. Root219]|uniref:ArnT family glycosyltransferase n=1 Tax=Acidovorax sp. Root219 TaxID=1736493 RepID=UPI0012F78947|nr:hypothetical protein [Acidovorax sp. Root219]